MKKILLTLLALSSLSGALFAEVTDSHKVLIEKLFEVTQAKDGYEKAMVASFDGMVNNDMIPEAQRGKMKKAFEKVKELMLEKMGWEVMKGEMVKIYAKHFSEEGLKTILPKLESEELKLYFQKNQEVMVESMAIGQKKGMELGPEIQKIMMEEMMK